MNSKPELESKFQKHRYPFGRGALCLILYFEKENLNSSCKFRPIHKSYTMVYLEEMQFFYFFKFFQFPKLKEICPVGSS